HGQGHEGRPREVSGGGRLRLCRQTREHRPAAVAGPDVAAPVAGTPGTMSAVEAPLIAMNDTDKVSILLVDDQPARLLSYESVLSSLGQNLVRAHSGAEALERLMQQDFAVILLDVNMPGMDGFETARLIHNHPRFEKTPIIFVTGVHVTELDQLQG